MDVEFINHEIVLLQQQVALLGEKNADGKWQVSFGKLYDETQQVFEALAGTLKAAKKRGIVDYAAPILLKGPSDKVLVILNVEATA